MVAPATSYAACSGRSICALPRAYKVSHRIGGRQIASGPLRCTHLLVEGAFAERDDVRRLGRHLASKLQRAGLQLIVRHHARHQARALRGRGVDGVAREQHLQRALAGCTRACMGGSEVGRGVMAASVRKHPPTERPRATAGVEQNKPTFTPGVANDARSEATAKSQDATSWQPAAVARAWT